MNSCIHPTPNTPLTIALDRLKNTYSTFKSRRFRFLRDTSPTECRDTLDSYNILENYDSGLVPVTLVSTSYSVGKGRVEQEVKARKEWCVMNLVKRYGGMVIASRERHWVNNRASMRGHCMEFVQGTPQVYCLWTPNWRDIRDRVNVDDGDDMDDAGEEEQ